MHPRTTHNGGVKAPLRQVPSSAATLPKNPQQTPLERRLAFDTEGAVLPRYQAHPTEAVSWVDLTASPLALQERVARELGVSLKRIQSIMTRNDMPQIARFENGVLLSLPMVHPGMPRGDRVQLRPYFVLVTENRVYTFHSGQAAAIDDLFSRLASRDEILHDAGAPDLALTLAALSLHDAHTTVTVLKREVDRMEKKLRFEPLGNREIEQLRSITDAADTIRSVMAEQENVPPILGAFFHKRGVDVAESTAEIWMGERRALLYDLDHNLQRDADTMWQSHLAVAANRTGAIAKNIAILSALALPQMAVSNFLSQGWLVNIGNPTPLVIGAHAVGLVASVVLLVWAKLKRWT